MKTIKQSDTETVLPCMQPHRALPVHEPYRVRMYVRGQLHKPVQVQHTAHRAHGNREKTTPPQSDVDAGEGARRAASGKGREVKPPSRGLAKQAAPRRQHASVTGATPSTRMGARHMT
jgi:hypothetical protein